MAEVSLSDLTSGRVTAPTNSDEIPASMAQNITETSKFEYTPPPQKAPTIFNRLEGVAKPIMELPQVGGNYQQLFGDLISSATRRDDLETSGAVPKGFFDKAIAAVHQFGDRQMIAGLAAKDNNKKWLTEQGMDFDPNIFDKMIQNSGFMGAAIAATALGIPAPVVLQIAAGGMAAAATPEAFNALRGRGDALWAAGAKASTIGLGEYALARFGFGMFKTETQAFLPQVMVNAGNAAAGGFLQSAGGGALSLATGLTPYSGPEDFGKVIGNAAEDAAVWMILGGSHGAFAAHQNYASIEQALIKEGQTPQEARTNSRELMSVATDNVMSWVETKLDMSPESRANIVIKRPDVMARVSDVLSKIEAGQKLDPLDYNYIPKEDRPPTTREGELQSNIDKLTQTKTDIGHLQELLKGNVEDQEVSKALDKDRQGIEKEVNASFEENSKQVNREFDAKEDSLVKESKEISARIEAINKQQDAGHLKLQEEDARLATKEGKAKEEPGSRPPTKRYKDIEYDIHRLENEKQKLLGRKAEIPQDRAENARQRQGTLKGLEAGRLKAIEERFQKESPVLRSAAKELEKLQEQHDRLTTHVGELKEELKGPGSKLSQLKRELKALERGVRTGTKEHKESVLSAAKQLEELLNDKEIGVSKEDKGKFLAKLKEISTASDPEARFQKLMPEIRLRIQRLTERAEKMEWRKDILKVEKGLEKLPIEYQDALDPIIKSLDLHYRTEKEAHGSKRTAEFLRKKLEAQGPLTDGERSALAAAETRNLSSLSHEELRALHDAIVETAHMGMRYEKLSKSKEAQAYQANVKSIVEHINADRELRKRDIAGEQTVKENRTQLQKIVAGHAWLNKAGIMPPYLLEKFGLKDYFLSIHEARQKSLEWTHTDKQQIDKLMSNMDPFILFGHPIPVEFENAGKMYSWTDVKGKDPETAARRLNTYLKIYAQAQNDKGRAHLVNTPGLSEGLVSKIETWLEKDYPTYTQGVRDVMDHFAPGGEAFDRLDKAVVDDKGHHLVPEENWDPIQRLINVPKGDWEWGNKGMYGRGAPMSGFTNARVNSELAFADFDWAGDIVRHITDRNHYIAMNRPLGDLYQVLHDPAVVEAIEQHPDGGKEVVTMMRKFLNDTAFNGHYMDSDMGRMYSKIRQNFASSKVMFNVISSLKVFVQYPIGRNYVGGGFTDKAAVQYLGDRKTWDSFIDEQSTFMRHYDERREPVLAEMSTYDKKALGAEAKIKEIKQLGWGMHKEANRITSRSVWLGQFSKSMAEGKIAGLEDTEAKAQAVKEADEAVYKTQSTGDIIYMPHIFREGELGRTLGMFHTDINKNYNLWAHDLDQVKTGDLPKHALIGKFIARAMVPALMLGLIERRRPLQKDELPAYLIDQILGTQPLLGVFTNSYVQGRFSPPMLPAGQVAQDIYDTFAASKPEGHFTKGIESIADFTGVPLGVIYRQLTLKAFQPRKDR